MNVHFLLTDLYIFVLGKLGESVHIRSIVKIKTPFNMNDPLPVRLRMHVAYKSADVLLSCVAICSAVKGGYTV